MYIYENLKLVSTAGDRTTLTGSDLTIRLTHGVPVIMMSTKLGTGGTMNAAVPGIKYPYTTTSNTTADTTKPSVYLFDDQYFNDTGKDRFKLLVVAESTYSERKMQVYFDTKEGYLIAVPDLDFDLKADGVDVLSHTTIDGVFIAGTDNVLNNQDVSIARFTEPYKWSGFKDPGQGVSKTHLLKTGNLPGNGWNNSGLMLGSDYIEGSINIPAQYVSLGKMDTYFTQGCPAYQLKVTGFNTFSVNFVGQFTVNDICFPLEF